MGQLVLLITFLFAKESPLLSKTLDRVELLYQEFKKPQKNISLRNRIFALSKNECALELSQLIQEKIGKDAPCHNRLWKVHFNYLHRADLIEIRSELDLALKQTEFEKMNDSQRMALRQQINSLQAKWNEFSNLGLE